MRLDLALTCRLVVNHLDEDGISATAKGREVRFGNGLSFRLRQEGKQDDESPGSMFWVDVDSLRLDPPMSLDLSGWGTTPEAVTTDAVHGLVTSVIPLVRWLAIEPWRPPADVAGQAVRAADEDGRPWTVVVGIPWVIIGTVQGGSGDADRLGNDLRQAITTNPTATLDALDEKVALLMKEPRGHWIKIFAARMPSDELTSRIDLDNRWSIESRPYAETIPWAAGPELQLVRQLVVLRPDGEASRTAPKGRLARLLGR